MENKKILIELSYLAPTLAKLPKKSILTVPLNYFEEVEEQIMSQLNLIKYETYSEMPAGYLDHIESDVVKWATQLVPKNANEPKYFNFLSIKKWMYAIAAVFVFATGAFIVFSIEQNKSTILEITQNEQDLYLDYLQHNIEEFDINSLIENDLVEESDVSFVVNEYESSESDADLFLESELNF